MYRSVFTLCGFKKQIREHAEPDGQTKNVDKRPQKEAQDARPSQAASFVSERVPPPAERQKKKDVGKKSPVRAPRRRGRPRSYGCRPEHAALPLLSGEAAELLSKLPARPIPTFDPYGKGCWICILVRPGWLGPSVDALTLCQLGSYV